MVAGDVDVSITDNNTFWASHHSGANDDVLMIDANPHAIDGMWVAGGAISFWVKANSDGENNGGRIIDRGNWRIYTSAEAAGKTKITFDWITDGIDGIFRTTNTVLTNRTWHHVVFNFDASNQTSAPVIYIDGVAGPVDTVSAPTGSFSGDTAVSMLVGDNIGSSRCFDGQIGDFHFYNAELTSAEATAAYAGTPAASKLIASIKWQHKFNQPDFPDTLNEGSWLSPIDDAIALQISSMRNNISDSWFGALLPGGQFMTVNIEEV